MTASATLHVERVVKTFATGRVPIRALDGVSFELTAGELTALRGPSGSGKSTLINLVSGWEIADSGRLWWSPGHALDVQLAIHELAWTHLAVVPQSLGLLEELSLRENVALPDRLAFGAAQTNWAAVDVLLEQLGLRGVANRMPTETSLGEQQRAAVGRALLLRPAFVIADEPTAHQDAAWVERIFSLLRAAADAGAACLVATHSAEGLAYADRILEMRDGRITELPVTPR